MKLKLLILLVLTTLVVSAKEYHVSVNGSDANNGSISKPFRTISAAAKMAMPGDVIIVHAGVYREQVAPPRGGNSEKERIWYRAAKGEKVEVKGSEIIKGWKRLGTSIWQVTIPNSFFGKFNPYRDTIHGDWLEKGSWCHTGEVYLNGTPLIETNKIKQLDSATIKAPHWYCKVDEKNTVIWADFFDVDPNEKMVEINVRQAVFYPSQTGINYIRISGFVMSQAATPWAPPTAEQIGLIGTHWSKGWIIENNDISYSKCVGITLGKYGDEWDNKSESVEGFTKTTERALDHSWNKEHIGSHLVRNNQISHCGQAGIAGSLGVVFSTISGNSIHDIADQKLFWGYEMAGIKLHAAIDVEISHNHIYRTEGGIWLDWMAQGTRVTKNFLHDNHVQDFSLEVDHGPVLVDNNLFLSPQQAQVRLSQGVAFVHNLIAWKLWETNDADPRLTPFLKPHSTAIAGFHNNPCGDTRFYNNVFLGRTDLSPYNNAVLPVQMEGNVYLMDAHPSKYEQQPVQKPDYNPAIEVEEKNEKWYLTMNLEKSWSDKIKPKLITSKLLGTAVVSEQSFDDITGNTILFNTDYWGIERDTKSPCAGPFEIKENERQRIRVW
ncbi:alpha-N-arabinofuranosidase [Mucilaginibacter mallensis]|uniref:Alpha-N-arabinofuranosidase n=1 Tax=Mucilaginibacter mallensis TaxID=652787 RepID=A0A1H1RG18_MUCMA|nr:right-handed parallel beta-helix repeat-containing protein [Mucilaginibacter mallensis]SDS34613.1 alpha-N-arabinofuranosidase [Mucilaginibacter mallensis]